MQQQAAVLIVGAGGHAKVVIELLQAQGRRVGGLVDADASPRQVLGVPVVGTDADLSRLYSPSLNLAFVAIGDNQTRLMLGRHVQSIGFQLVNAISPAAVVSPSCRLGAGIAVMAGAIINADAEICDFAIINTGASIDHDCIVGEASHIGPGATIAGCVTIGRQAFLGVGSHVIPQLSIGDGALIGAGSCVVRNIPAYAVARGVPARIVNAHDRNSPSNDLVK
jgi:UDP-perosamine 4-acetyltransferase